MIDELGGTEDVQPLPDRLGDGVQHAVQDVEALRVQRRHLRPVHHLVAGGHQGARRDPRPVPPRDRPRPDGPRRASASSRPRRSRGTPSRRIDGVSMRDSFDDAVGRVRAGRRSSTRCSARARSGTKAGRPVTTHPPHRRAGATSTTTSGSSTTPTSTAPSCTTSPPSSRDKLRELVNIWFSEAGANGAFPLDDRIAGRDPDDAAAAAHRAAGPVRLLPGRRADAGVAGASTSRTARS